MKNVRQVNPYTRYSKTQKKRVEVKGYSQRHDTPRGKISGIGVDAPSNKSKTFWLMDSHGHFVGRANAEGRTSTPKDAVAHAGMDRTRAIRETPKYKRVFGRVPDPSKSHRRRG